MRELAISIYLIGFKLLFTVSKLFPLKNKVTFLVSFPENSKYIYQELQRQKIDVEVIFLCNKRCFEDFKRINKYTYLVESRNLIHTIVGIYHIATSKQVIVDNYYGFLSTTSFKKDVQCIQIWHAVGAIKRFGAQDATNIGRTPAARRRFKKVYKQFGQFAIGSGHMEKIFKKAFLVEEGLFLKTGVPRTDFLFDETKHRQIEESLLNCNMFLKDKKVILYAPTFRRYESDPENMRLDLQKMYTALKGEYVLLIKFHPEIKLQLDLGTEYQRFVFNYSDYPNINELMIISDILITDYSSIPMEFALLKRKMIFFAYDLEVYKKENGLWEVYDTSVPGPVVKNTDEIIDAIVNHQTNLRQIDAYAQKWSEYCDGNASQKFVEEVFKS